MKKHPGGRPKTTVEERVEKISLTFDTVFELAKTGITDRQLATILGVHPRTIDKWKKKSDEFRAVLKKGKEFADSFVELALFRRATGYTYGSEKIMVLAKGGGKGSNVVRVPVRMHLPPDSTACIFWLKNRQPDKWRD